MSDEEVALLERILTLGGGKLYYKDSVNGVLIPISSISHNHRFNIMPNGSLDPQEIPESAAWLANSNGKCIGLLNALPEDFKFMLELKVNFSG